MPTEGFPELDPVQSAREFLEVLDLAEHLPRNRPRTPLDPERTFTKIIEQARQRRQAAGQE